MSPRTGRPKSDNKLEYQIKIRADKQTVDDLNFCSKEGNMSKSDVIRLGIQKIKSELENKE